MLRKPLEARGQADAMGGARAARVSMHSRMAAITLRSAPPARGRLQLE